MFPPVFLLLSYMELGSYPWELNGMDTFLFSFLFPRGST